MEFVLFMTSEQSQRAFLQHHVLPSRKSLYDDPLLEEDPTLRASQQQLEQGRIMPVDTKLRAVWDAMRPPYQALLGGSVTPRRGGPADAAGCNPWHQSDEPHHPAQHGSLGLASGGTAPLRGAFLLAAKELDGPAARRATPADCLPVRRAGRGYDLSDRGLSVHLQRAALDLEHVAGQFPGLANHRLARTTRRC